MFRRNTSIKSTSAIPDKRSSSKKNREIVIRSRSVPGAHPSRLRGILRYCTVDDSLHSEYRSETKKVDIHVSFDKIEIREYARTIGDNPSCSSGPPVSISWEYAPSVTLSLDTYENTRPPRRSNIEMILPRNLRQTMLKKEWNVTQSQIAAAIRTNIKVKNQRRQTVSNLGKSTKLEETMENASKCFIAGMFGKNTDKQVRKLQLQMEAAEKARNQMQLDMEELASYGSYDTDEQEETVPMELDQ